MFTVREARRSDLPGIAALEAALFTRGAEESGLERMLSDGRHVLLMAEEAGELLGFAWYEHVLDEGYLGDLAAHPAQRRRGVGAALGRALLRDAAARGLRFLTLEVRESNLPARRLYEKLGFVRVGERKNYYERPREDAVLLTAFLPGGEEPLC